MEAVYRLLRRRLNWFGGARPVPDTAVAGSETHYSFTRSQDKWASELPRRDGEPQPRNVAESILRKRIMALAATEARFHSLTLLGSDWHWDQDAQFRFTAVSGNLADPIAVAIEQHLGRTLWELPQVEPHEGGWEAHRRCLHARGDVSQPRSARDAAGRQHQLRLDQRRTRFRQGWHIPGISRHRARHDEAETDRGEHQPARPLRSADRSVQPYRVLRAAESCARRRTPA